MTHRSEQHCWNKILKAGWMIFLGFFRQKQLLMIDPLGYVKNMDKLFFEFLASGSAEAGAGIGFFIVGQGGDESVAVGDELAVCRVELDDQELQRADGFEATEELGRFLGNRQSLSLPKLTETKPNQTKTATFS